MLSTLSIPSSQNLLPATDTISAAMQAAVQRIQHDNVESTPRGMAVREIELATLPINPLFCIPHFESRPFNWRYFLGEISWYLTRDCNIEWINNFSNFWSSLSENGTINSNYGHILFGEQLQWAKDALLADPESRQAISFVNQPRYQYPGNKDFVCTMYLNFWIREDKLHMKVQMRSNDVFYGLTYDAPFFATIMQTMWYWLQPTYPALQLGTYHHCADNLHYYKRHFDLAAEIAQEELGNPLFCLLKEPLFNVNNGIYVLTPAGTRLLQEVSAEVHAPYDFNQERAKEIALNYFYIQ